MGMSSMYFGLMMELEEKSGDHKMYYKFSFKEYLSHILQQINQMFFEFCSLKTKTWCQKKCHRITNVISKRGYFSLDQSGGTSPSTEPRH